MDERGQKAKMKEGRKKYRRAIKADLLNRPIKIIQDALLVAEGGFYEGQVFTGIESREMFKNCSFTDGTLVSICGHKYQIETVEIKEGLLKQIPVIYKEK